MNVNEYIFLFSRLIGDDWGLSRLRKQDIPQFVQSLANNPVGRRLAYDFFEDNFNALYARYFSFKNIFIQTLCLYLSEIIRKKKNIYNKNNRKIEKNI